jgi:hypothetical protein
MSMYDDLFGQFNQPVAQILLTRNDLADVCNHKYFVSEKITNSLFIIARTIFKCSQLLRRALRYGRCSYY